MLYNSNIEHSREGKTVETVEDQLRDEIRMKRSSDFLGQ